ERNGAEPGAVGGRGRLTRGCEGLSASLNRCASAEPHCGQSPASPKNRKAIRQAARDSFHRDTLEVARYNRHECPNCAVPSPLYRAQRVVSQWPLFAHSGRLESTYCGHSRQRPWTPQLGGKRSLLHPISVPNNLFFVEF